MVVELGPQPCGSFVRVAAGLKPRPTDLNRLSLEQIDAELARVVRQMVVIDPRNSRPDAGAEKLLWSPMPNGALLPTRPMKAPASAFGSGEFAA